MQCPACVQFDVTTEAAVQVSGTLYCAFHGVEALAREMGPQRGPRNPLFSPPPPPVVLPPGP